MTIRERFHEPLSLDDMARSAMMSKYYFLRLFSRVTGVTPGRYLSAVRLHEAKRLLLTTSLNVADISAQVGYSSTGTFSRRFSESVGVSPTQYRRLECAEPIRDAQADQDPAVTPLKTVTTVSLTGTIQAKEPPLSAVYLGVFDSPILQGRPVATTFASDEFHIDGVPLGTWYLHAVAHSAAEIPDEPYSEPPPLVDVAGPLQCTAGGPIAVDLFIRPSDWTRPPILSALPVSRGRLPMYGCAATEQPARATGSRPMDAAAVADGRHR